MAFKDKEREREYYREYRQRPEVKEHRREYNREYEQRPEVKEHRREYEQRTEVKEHRREYCREYRQRPEVKERNNAKQRIRYQQKINQAAVDEFLYYSQKMQKIDKEA